MSDNFGKFTSVRDLRRNNNIFQQLQNGRVGRTFPFEPTADVTQIHNPVFSIDSFVSLQPLNASAANTKWFIDARNSGTFTINLIDSDLPSTPKWIGIIIGQK